MTKKGREERRRQVVGREKLKREHLYLLVPAYKTTRESLVDRHLALLRWQSRHNNMDVLCLMVISYDPTLPR